MANRKIDDIEGIGAVTGEKFRAAGVKDTDTLLAKWKIWLRDAKATDGMESPAKFAPEGSWTRSRRGGRSGDRGSRNRLIG